MKKTLFLSLCLLLISITSRAQMTYEELKAQIAQINSMLPLSTGPSMTLTSVSINPKQVTYEMKLTSLVTEVPKIDEEKMKNSAIVMLSNNESMKAFLKPLVELNISMLYIYNIENGKSFKVELTPNDLTRILTDSYEPMEKINMLISTQKLNLPTALVPGLSMIDVRIINGNFEWVLEIDETMQDMDAIEKEKEDRKQQAAYFMKNDLASQEQMKMMVAANLGMCYNYVGNITKKSVKIVFSKPELNTLIIE